MRQVSRTFAERSSPESLITAGGFWSQRPRRRPAEDANIVRAGSAFTISPHTLPRTCRYILSVRPPSTGIEWPVMKLASSDARKGTTFASSSSTPGRFKTAFAVLKDALLDLPGRSMRWSTYAAVQPRRLLRQDVADLASESDDCPIGCSTRVSPMQPARWSGHRWAAVPSARQTAAARGLGASDLHPRHRSRARPRPSRPTVRGLPVCPRSGSARHGCRWRSDTSGFLWSPEHR
jgi:hypothetical protein